MGKRLIIKDADFSANAVVPADVINLQRSMILSGHGYFILSNNKTAENSDSWKGGFFDISNYIEKYKRVLLKPRQEFARIAFLTELPDSVGQNISYAAGYDTFITIRGSDTQEYDIPDNTLYLYVMYYNVSVSSGANIFPSIFALKSSE